MACRPRDARAHEPTQAYTHSSSLAAALLGRRDLQAASHHGHPALGQQHGRGLAGIAGHQHKCRHKAKSRSTCSPRIIQRPRTTRRQRAGARTDGSARVCDGRRCALCSARCSFHLQQARPWSALFSIRESGSSCQLVAAQTACCGGGRKWRAGGRSTSSTIPGRRRAIMRWRRSKPASPSCQCVFWPPHAGGGKEALAD